MQTFKYVGGTRMPIGRSRELFRNPATGQVVMAEKESLAAASLCRQFATLEAHAPRVQAVLDHASATPERWTTLLREAAADGLLMSAQDVTEYILARLAAVRPPCVIDRIAIPTRNRPRMLARLLASLAAHLREWDHRVELLVMDDSAAPDMQQANLAAVRACSGDPHLEIRYGDLRTRSRFARALSDESGVPHALVSAAIEGSPGYPVSTGAGRNAILLETVGHGLLFMDDDVQCRFVPVPGASHHVAFQGEALSTSFFESWDDVHRGPFTPLDLVRAHEQILNLDRRAVDPGNPQALAIDTSRVSARFLKAIARGNARVAISLMGIVGDSGWDDPFGYFLLGDETFAHLTRSEQGYRAAMRNRLLLSGHRHLCVSDQCTCHSTCMGADNRSLLPPFTPVMRGQDLVFGSLMTKCVPDALFGAIPAAILHEPGEPREFAPDAAVTRAGRLMTGETLALIARLEPVRGSSSAARMRSLGHHLQELKDLSAADFAAHARAAVEPITISCLQQLEAAIERHAKGATFWLDDALAIRSAAMRALNQRNHAAPSDLEGVFGQERATEHFRRLVDQFGTLLTAWPDLVSAAARLHAQGTDICLRTDAAHPAR